MLDDFRRLDGHLVRQFSHGDGLRHMHLNHTGFHRLLLLRMVIAAVTVMWTTASTRAAAPIAVAANAARAVATGLDFFLLGRVTCPAGRQLG